MKIRNNPLIYQGKPCFKTELKLFQASTKVKKLSMRLQFIFFVFQSEADTIAD